LDTFVVGVKNKCKVKLRDIPNQTIYLMVLSASTLMQATHCPEIITLQLHNLLTMQKVKRRCPLKHNQGLPNQNLPSPSKPQLKL
jgi:hypothetical protein